MEKSEVIRLYNLFQDNGIKIWIDGGWGIDALLGDQTRPHADLDIAVNRKNIAKLRELLPNYKENQDKPSEKNFVLEDGEGNKIDVHAFEFDDNGNNIFGILYPKDSLTGTGKIDGVTVNCIPPEWVVTFHGYYEPKEKDLKDIEQLCAKFGLEPPENYKKYPGFNEEKN